MTPTSALEATCSLALLATPGIGTATAWRLRQEAGCAAAVWEHRHDIRALVPDVSDRAARAVAVMEAQWDNARRQVDDALRRGLTLLTPADEAYPLRLLHSAIPPLVLFYKGTADLNAAHVVAVVGTRRISEYGKDVCLRLGRELAAVVPDVLVVSGLAYGVDVHAHRAALANGLNTVGVLAHGLDMIYPSAHRDTAAQMVAHGGVLSEYVCGTRVAKENFVQRNRIVAGLSDACIVVESAERGGALITARMALDDNREVYACPGRLTDAGSAGCLHLIARQGAALFTSVEELAADLHWRCRPMKTPVQRSLFVELTPTESRLLALLEGHDALTVNHLVAASALPVAEVSSTLFSLELKGMVKALAGNAYRRID